MQCQRDVRPGYDMWTPAAMCQLPVGNSPPPVQVSLAQGESPQLQPLKYVRTYTKPAEGVAAVALKFMKTLTSAHAPQPSIFFQLYFHNVHNHAVPLFALIVYFK